MKLKLVESVKPIIKLERNINNKLIPALEQMGYNINLSRTLREKYVNTYFGIYTDYKGLEIPFELELNTSSPFIDDAYQLFATLKLGGETFKLGAIDSNEGKELQNMIDNSIPNPNKISSKWNGDTSEEKITSNDGKESHTRAEWKELYKKNKKEMSPTQFGSWWNNKYPTKL